MPRKPFFTSERNVFAERLTAIMKERGENQTTLADKITAQYVAIQRQTISLYMNGQSKPDTERIAALAKVLDVSADYLLGLTDTASSDTSTRAICQSTGLSEKAVTTLQKINNYPHGVLGVVSKGYTIGIPDILSELISSKRFLKLISELGFYLIYGGVLPKDAYSGKQEKLSFEEEQRFYQWANRRGLEIIERKDVRELHLQKACDELKAIFKECLECVNFQIEQQLPSK